MWEWLAQELGGPLSVWQWLGGVAVWVLLMAVTLAAVLGAVLAEVRPWLPTTVDDWVPEMTETEQGMVYGSPSQAKPVDRTPDPWLEPLPGHESPPETPWKRPRSAWVDD